MKTIIDIYKTTNEVSISLKSLRDHLKENNCGCEVEFLNHQIKKLEVIEKYLYKRYFKYKF